MDVSSGKTLLGEIISLYFLQGGSLRAALCRLCCGTWTGDVLQVTQAGLLGQAVDELAGFAVLVAGRQLQRGQLLHRVLVQHQALVDHHAGRKVVLWGVGRKQQRREHQCGGGLK